MSYELERMQKERNALFEAEMQRRANDLKVYLDFMNWAHYLQNNPQLRGVPEGQEGVQHRIHHPNSPPAHLPNGLDEWLHREVRA